MAKTAVPEKFHFTKDGVLYHQRYTVSTTRNGIHWEKEPGSDEECLCPEYESDRKALELVRAQGQLL